ncbi:hypothetical protein FV232_27255 [Methylobacterium sp. WL30]|nr:hypothetical protein FV225_20830 [Methylobacterium sp. WL93]TXN50022.1 hypothetical protein FV227_14175 [Methylobacterium sp. WL119]TXN61332.1 hypothetical protein FV232_27255 [Methylobacterium sp. WL30]
MMAARAVEMFVLSLMCLVSGATLAGIAPHRPVRRAAFESMGGCLVVGGLCLLGTGLPLFR